MVFFFLEVFSSAFMASVRTHPAWPAFVFLMKTASREDDSGEIGRGSDPGFQARRMRHREMSYPVLPQDWSVITSGLRDSGAIN